MASLITDKARWSEDSDGIWISLRVKDRRAAIQAAAEITKPHTVDIKQYREKRSLDANAYFHVLVNGIAAVMHLGDYEVKKSLVLEYGTLAKDADGVTVGFKLPVTVDVDTIYDYAKVFKVVEEGGKLFNCYLVYKRTRHMDTKEFCRLIDGAIFVAKELGITTDTPEQLAKYKEVWNAKGN